MLPTFSEELAPGRYITGTLLHFTQTNDNIPQFVGLFFKLVLTLESAARATPRCCLL
jgi:hypothetical protein